MNTVLIPALAALLLTHFGPLKDGRNWYMNIINTARIWLKRRRLRPFDCTKCMSGWLCIPWAYYTDPLPVTQQYWYIMLPAYMIGAMAWGTILEKLYKGEL